MHAKGLLGVDTMANLIDKLTAARAVVAALESRFIKQRARDFPRLHSIYGFETPGGFIEAYCGGAGTPTPEISGATHSSAAAKGGQPGKKGKGKRAVVTDETRAQVKDLTKEGKTLKEVAAATGISVASVSVIKRKLGLTKRGRG